MTTSLNEVFEFLDIAAKKNLLNDNTVQARRTACNKFFEVLDEDQKTVEYVRANLEVIKTQFSNRYKEVRGNTVDEYARRVQLVLDDFDAWKSDRGAWERDIAARQSARAASGDGERKPRTSTRTEKPKSSDANAHGEHRDARVVKFPMRPDFELTVSLPRDGLTVQELQKLLYFLLPYSPDWQPTQSPRSVFPVLESNDREMR